MKDVGRVLMGSLEVYESLDKKTPKPPGEKKVWLRLNALSWAELFHQDSHEVIGAIVWHIMLKFSNKYKPGYN